MHCQLFYSDILLAPPGLCSGSTSASRRSQHCCTVCPKKNSSRILFKLWWRISATVSVRYCYVAFDRLDGHAVMTTATSRYCYARLFAALFDLARRTQRNSVIAIWSQTIRWLRLTPRRRHNRSCVQPRRDHRPTTTWTAIRRQIFSDVVVSYATFVMTRTACGVSGTP